MSNRLTVGGLLLSIEVHRDYAQDRLDKTSCAIVCQEEYRDEHAHGSSDWLREERAYRDIVRTQAEHAVEVAVAEFAARALLIFADGNANNAFALPLRTLDEFEAFLISTPELFDVAERITRDLHEGYDLRRGFPTHAVMRHTRRWLRSVFERLQGAKKND